MIEVHVHRPVMGFGYDSDVAIAFADVDVDAGDDDAVVVVVGGAVCDDCVNEFHAVMNVAYLRFSLHVRPANCHNMAMKSDCMQPTSHTFRPWIVVHWHMVANSLQHVHCSMWDLVYCL